MSKKDWASFNFVVSILVVVGAVFIFSSRKEENSKPEAAKPTVVNRIDSPAKRSSDSASAVSGGVSGAQPLVALPQSALPQSAGPQSAGLATPATPDSAALASQLSNEMAAQLKAPPPELPEDLKRQLAAPPPELPDDLKAQLNSPPPPLPDDIKRALETPPRIVTLDEVNGTKSETK